MSQRNWAEKPSGYKPARVDDVDEESPRPDAVEYKRYNLFTCNEWGLEIVTSIGSLAILAVVAYIFSDVDGKPLSAWTLPISLNALVSVLTTTASAAIMHGVSAFISQLKWLHFKNGPQKLEHLEKFDGASRGPWGSLKFLVSMKLNLATIGALITIVRLGLSPLAQQVVKIDERSVNSTIDENVTFGFAHAYNRGVIFADLRTFSGGIPQDPNMQAAILQGLYNISTPATFACPVSCKWQGSYVSLGFTTECRDVTQTTLQSQVCEHPTDSIENCNMTTPGNIGLSSHRQHTEWGTRYQMNVSLSKRPDEFPELARFAIYRASPDHNFQLLDVNVTECSLSLAAFNYTDAQSNGTAFAFGDTQEIDLGGKEFWSITNRSYFFDGTRFTSNSKATNLPAFELCYDDLQALQDFFRSEAITTEWVDGSAAASAIKSILPPILVNLVIFFLGFDYWLTRKYGKSNTMVNDVIPTS
ncbi:hypothetical protein CKAH01_17891 [Colletotrichum kahawae]|uniref:Uncharacterized protein n=1 Tax=Colletotrichum kahawae TaxID=34407 RepID=A0AAD9Y8F1_COLKA|nr:hypothetical protein CKAH01_17891 [Colletotrichum kahawae]